MKYPPLLSTAAFWNEILKLLRSSGIDAKESIPPANVAYRAGTTYNSIPTRYL